MLGWWALFVLGWLWRRTLWHEAGSAIREVAEGGAIRPLWLGWRVQQGDLRVDWRIGLRGRRTIVRRGAQRRVCPGLLSAAEVRQAQAGAG